MPGHYVSRELPAGEASMILGIVEKVVDVSIDTFGDQEGWEFSFGSVFCLLEAATKLPFLRVDVALVRNDQREEFHRLVMEKAVRLADNASVIGRSSSSFQTRNPEKNQLGGAIATQHFIFSFGGGLPELGCEAAALVVAVKTVELEDWEAKTIAQSSENPYFERLLREVEKWDK